VRSRLSVKVPGTNMPLEFVAMIAGVVMMGVDLLAFMVGWLSPIATLIVLLLLIPVALLPIVLLLRKKD